MCVWWCVDYTIIIIIIILWWELIFGFFLFFSIGNSIEKKMKKSINFSISKNQKISWKRRMDEWKYCSLSSYSRQWHLCVCVENYWINLLLSTSTNNGDNNKFFFLSTVQHIWEFEKKINFGNLKIFKKLKNFKIKKTSIYGEVSLDFHTHREKSQRINVISFVNFIIIIFFFGHNNKWF